MRKSTCRTSLSIAFVAFLLPVAARQSSALAQKITFAQPSQTAPVSQTASVERPSSATTIRATWRPDVDPLESDLDVAEALLNRRLPRFARDELDQVADDLAESLASSTDDAKPSSETLARFGALALRAATEAARLDDSDDQNDVKARVKKNRALVENNAPDLWKNLNANSNSLAYAAEIARSLADLGEFDPESLRQAKEFAKERVLNSPEECARPFLYRLAKIAIVEKDFDAAEKFAKALEKSAQKDAQDDYFRARVLLVEILRERGELDDAKSALAATLDAYKKIADDPDAPYEVPVAALVQEARLLLAEGQILDAVRQISQSNDLLGAPLPARFKRRVHLYDDVFDQLEAAKATVFLTALRDDVTPENAEEDFKESLLAAARNAIMAIESAALRNSVQRLARDLGENANDYATARNAADELYRDRRWRDALRAYDRAAELAKDAQANQDAFEIQRVAAALVDKICRENLFDSEDDLKDKSPEEWRRDAASRFETVARANLADDFAPNAFLIALQYRRELREDLGDAPFEFFDLFPNATIKDRVAFDLARDRLGQDDLDSAERAFDRVANSPENVENILELDAAMLAYDVNSGADPQNANLRSAQRLLRKFDPNISAPLAAKDVDALAEQVQTTAPEEFELALLAEACARLVASDLESAHDLPQSLARLVDDLRNAARAKKTRATLASAKVALALAYGSADDALAAFNADKSNAGESTATLRQAIKLAQDASPDTRRQIAEFVWNATNDVKSPNAQAAPDRLVARAQAAILLGKKQDALTLFAKTRKADPKNVDANRGIARLLADSQDPAVVERALQYWSDVADALPDSSKEWWDAKEECVRIYCRLGKLENARKMTQTLWLTRSDPSDPNRKQRWDQALRK